MTKEDLKEIVLEKSEGLFSTLTDLILFTTLFVGTGGFGEKTLMANLNKSQLAMELIKEKETFNAFKSCLYRLKRKGLINYLKGKILEPEITRAGRKRIENLVPSYDEKRVWDERVYLVTYDIPEKQKGARELFREFIKRIGAAQLQASVYLTLYNPKRLVSEFIKEQNLEGTVIISDLGKDGAVGEKDIKSLIVDLYQLDSLNERYREFISQYKNGGKVEEVAFSFYSILQDDPQLPFELLPSWWKGKRAYRLFKKLVFQEN